ncbi:MAG: fused HPr family phosphocarrier protein/2-hydroxyacid dehydrogenase [Lachnospiraceae bacterium]|jgi:D-lactate dehydrogenase|nr:HPr family phosphocarrier protein [Lachnospiraceae bacterium]MBR7016143.1 HPr family phosphocarrier protein [Lachnospiraceae bacterium]MEE1110165.1 fused HPr family phosphocarrier protein/2-hydroxyacid dehydrogenase [Lachnospiraceae bacterium]MEE3457122.1 fused HPr family phosphocarrier protein/2-hydroxyacid dehydrogenase [Lachnospiraceae bacterium]
MKSYTHVVVDPLGIHARPAAQIAQACVNFRSAITITCGEHNANGNNVLQILGLHAVKGSTLLITAEGDDEEAAIEAISRMLKEKAAQKKPVGILKIAFFGAKDYDHIFFNELAKDKGEGTYNCDIKYFSTRLTPETAALAKGYDAVCIFVNDECPRAALETLKECGVRLVLLRCAGFNNVDLVAAREFGITVLRVPAYSPYAVAEHAMAIIQAANRRLNKAVNKVRDNNFALSGLLGVDLHNKVAGIVGTGKIGQCMARICKGFGMTVIGWDAYPNQALVDEGLLTYVSKDELFAKSDLISLHAPLIMGDGGTYHLINKAAIDKMKDTVMLVNTARGGLIDTEDLISALKEGKFHAVALDVYEGEDSNVYTDHSADAMMNDITARLQMFPQLILTSHQAFFTREALQAIAATTMENARNFNEGNPYGMAEVK